MNKIHGEGSQGGDLICRFNGGTAQGRFCACDASVFRVKTKTCSYFLFFLFVAFKRFKKFQSRDSLLGKSIL